MRLYLLNSIILLLFVQVKSNNEFKQEQINNEVANSNDELVKNMEGQCYAYCFTIVKPLLEHTVSVQVKEQKIQEQSISINNLSNKLADLQAKVGIYEEIIRNNEKYKNETQDMLKLYEETIKNQNERLAEQLLTSERSKNEILLKLGICEDYTQKLKNEAIDKNNAIVSKDEIQAQMKEKLIEYKIKSESCISSSCVGKLNAIYDIKIPGMDAFSVPCDSSTAGSGWTVIQRRLDGSVNFTRNWSEYRQGFGNLSGEFFIGLEKLHLLTRSQNYELYILLKDFENESRYAKYADFVVGTEEEFYKLTLGLYSGNATDSLGNHHNTYFSTPDRDNDSTLGHCAHSFKSGWWFSDCFHCNLNGPYSKEDFDCSADDCIEWRGWKKDRPLKFTQMMIRPKPDLL